MFSVDPGEDITVRQYLMKFAVIEIISCSHMEMGKWISFS